MKSFHGEALILDVFDLHEQDRIVTFLTRERGQKRGVARGARRKYSRFAGQLQPLAKVRVRWFEKDGRDLVRIGEVDLLRPAHRLQGDLEGLMLGSYLAEHLTEFVQENEPGDLWFRLLDSTIEALLAGVDPDLAARYFETWVLRLAGVFPETWDCPLCGEPFTDREDDAPPGAVLAPGDDALICRSCAAQASGAPELPPEVAGAPLGQVVSPDLLALLQRMGRQSLQALAGHLTLMAEQGSLPPERLHGELLRQAEALAGRVRRAFLGKELRSQGVIQSLGRHLP